VPGLVPEGLCILAGKPKIGKSWLALEMCLGVALKENVLGDIEPVHGDVLYCALEERRAGCSDAFVSCYGRRGGNGRPVSRSQRDGDDSMMVAWMILPIGRHR